MRFNDKIVAPLSRILTITSLVLFGISGFAKEITSPQVYQNEDGSLTFDVVRSCAESPCDISYKGIRLRIEFESKAEGNTYLFKVSKLRSNIGIKGIRVISDNIQSGYCPITEKGRNHFQVNLSYSGENWDWGDCFFKRERGPIYYLEIKKASNERNWLSSVTVDAGSFNLPEDLKIGTVPIYLMYKYSLDRLLDFESNAKGSDRRHLQRLKETLLFTLNLMADSAGNPVLPVTHVKITEQSRMILVLSTVLKELLEDYSAASAEAIRMPVLVLMKLPDQIRGAYGWDTGLAGSGSTATAALAEIFDTELQELYYAAASFGGIQGLKPTGFQKLMTATGKMSLAVRTANGGDAAIGFHLKAFSEAWNSDEWQAVLVQLINAPKDRFQLVQPKLTILLKAAESYSDFVDPKGRNGLWLKISDEIKNKIAEAEKATMSVHVDNKKNE